MQTINIHDAKTQFSKLIEAVSQGERVIIAKAGKPVAELVAIESAPPARQLNIRPAANRSPNTAFAAYNQGAELIRQRRWESAVASFTRAIEHNPQFVNAYYNIGLAYTQLGDYELAKDAYRQRQSMQRPGLLLYGTKQGRVRPATFSAIPVFAKRRLPRRSGRDEPRQSMLGPHNPRHNPSDSPADDPVSGTRPGRRCLRADACFGQ